MRYNDRRRDTDEMTLDSIFQLLKDEVWRDGKSLRYRFAMIIDEEDNIPLFKFTGVMSDILETRGETFAPEIDKFARLFMVQGSKSLISFKELEMQFGERYKEYAEDKEYELIWVEALFKYISYKCIREELNL